ncbi:hypothetical protein LSCM1_05509 [Leishmania martiniquensis]|uniref:CFA20 domain-containing protein n=1 Tax=Leishmania martiniquensis TaxID=1580590 RepID=A0A836KQ80_9TRYP|nr:hypothetical protein LSCM1_05509 [Leishmania martiniquensis]
MVGNAATPPAALRVESAATGTKRAPYETHTSSSRHSTSPAASAVAVPPHRTAPCIVLFSPKGPRPLEGLKTVTLTHSSNTTAFGTGRGHVQTRGTTPDRLSAVSSLPLSGCAAAVAARASCPPASGIRCVYDRDTRSQLLHIAPGTEVDFSSCMRLPALASISAPAAGAAATPVLFAAASLHTILAVQFCMAVPPLSTAARQSGEFRPLLLASPIPSPGSFHIELVFRTGTSCSTARGRSNASSGGYRLRFTNAGHNAQRHAHHTKIPLQCVRTAQWVQLFLDLEALLQSCQAAGAVVAGGPPCRLQQLRIGSGGSSATTGGIYVRRIIAGHGLPLPHPAIHHLFTGNGAAGKVAVMTSFGSGAEEMARDTNGEGLSGCLGFGTRQQRSGSCWAMPEALRLPAEAGESLCVFVRTGDEYVLSEAPALPAPAEAPPVEDEVHSRDRDGVVQAAQMRWRASNCAGEVDEDAAGWASDATHDAAKLQATEAVPEPLTSLTSAAQPLHRSQSQQPGPYQRRSRPLSTSHQSTPENESAALRGAKMQPRLTKEQHHTALEMLRMRDHQHQSAHQLAGSTPATHAPAPDDPLSPSFPHPASPASFPEDASSLSASEDAETFVIREVSAAEQLAPATPPQYPTNQLMTGKPPLPRTQPQPPIATEVTHHEKGEEHMIEEMEEPPARKDAAPEDAGEGSFSGSTAGGVASLLFSATNSSATATTSTAVEVSVLSDAPYTSAIELMEEMSERVRRIHTVLAGAEEEMAAAPVTATPVVSQPVAKSPSPHHAVRPSLLMAQGARPSASTAAAPSLPPFAPPPPPPLAAAAETDFPSPLLSVAAPTAPADLMQAALSGMRRDVMPAAAAICSVPLRPPPTAAMGATKHDSVSRVAVADATATAPATPGDTNAILELWSSAERPLRLPEPSERPATATDKASPRAGRLREYPAALSSPFSAASFPKVDGGNDDNFGGAPSCAISPPTSAVTSWTFQSASLIQQTPSVLRRPTTPGAEGELLPRAGGASSDDVSDAGKGNGAPPLRQALQPFGSTHRPDAEISGAIIPPSKSSSGQVTKAVVWRRPVPVPGRSPFIGDATQRALQDEVRLTDTPLSRLGGVPGVGNAGARRIVAWSARQNTGPSSSGRRTPLFTGVSGLSGVAPRQGSPQVFINAAELCAGAQVPPPPPSGRSFSTVSSFQMWLPSSSMPTLSASRGRYPSATTPSSGRDRHGGPTSVSSSGADDGPLPPQLRITAAPSSARPPLPPPTSAHTPRAAFGTTVPTCSAGDAVRAAPLAQQQRTQDFPVTTFSRDPPQPAFTFDPDAPPSAVPLPAQPTGKEGRYVYDCVLQCYLDLETNSYVGKA